MGVSPGMGAKLPRPLRARRPLPGRGRRAADLIARLNFLPFVAGVGVGTGVGVEDMVVVVKRKACAAPGSLQGAVKCDGFDDYTRLHVGAEVCERRR